MLYEGWLALPAGLLGTTTKTVNAVSSRELWLYLKYTEMFLGLGLTITGICIKKSTEIRNIRNVKQI